MTKREANVAIEEHGRREAAVYARGLAKVRGRELRGDGVRW
jgi:hypothetical protein